MVIKFCQNNYFVKFYTIFLNSQYNTRLKSAYSVRPWDVRCRTSQVPTQRVLIPTHRICAFQIMLTVEIGPLREVSWEHQSRQGEDEGEGER